MLSVAGVGASRFLKLDFAPRLNLITGDNGLGKSFLLECAWWALTRTWTNYPVFPRQDAAKEDPLLQFETTNAEGETQSVAAKFDWRAQDWKVNGGMETETGLVVYARVDGGFSIWDPARFSESASRHDNTPAALVLSRAEVWDGAKTEDASGKSRNLLNGLITDWIHWQHANNEAFGILKKVLKRLSPPGRNQEDLGELIPGNPTRIHGESRPMPTIVHSYGEVPVLYASAAVKRILAFAYLVVWTWEEHKILSQLIQEAPKTKLLILADEIESHLHPQWQRALVPALTSVAKDLNSSLQIQYILTTHSPLILASSEQIFDEETDRVFHLNLKRGTGKEAPEVIVEQAPFIKQGSADQWLVSDIFGLGQATSIESEKAIYTAKSLMKEDNVSIEQIKSLSEQLTQTLPAHDKFWIRWNYFAEQKGVKN